MLIGVLHLLPTDDPNFLDHAVRNAKRLEEAGVDAIIVENFYDARTQTFAVTSEASMGAADMGVD
jgi:predicted TIM-barrel enzyme